MLGLGLALQYELVNRGFNSWTPAKLSNLMCWLDASTLLGANSTSIETIPDLSGNGFSATQLNESNKPTLLAGSNGINGLKVARFDGTDDFMTVASYRPVFTGITIFAVIRPTVASNGNWRFLISQPGRRLATGMSGFSAAHGLIHFWEQGAAVYGYTEPTAANTVYILEVIEEPGTAIHIKLNGTEGTSTGNATDPVDGATGDLLLGTYLSAGSLPWSGDLGELIICDAQLSADDATKTRNHLAAKWGISI